MKILTIIALFLLINSGIIHNDCVDNVKLGMDISEFLERKSKIYEVEKATINLEGDEYPIFNVYENSELIYAVEPDEKEEKVWRIWLYGKKFKTDTGIGVGNTLGDLKKKYNITELSTAEGSIVILVNETEIGFNLNVSQVDEKWWDRMMLDELNDDVQIDLIII